MSAGNGHSRPNMRHPGELQHILSTGGAPALMNRWQALDVDHDIADLAGYNVAGFVRYLDRDFLRALLDPAYATEILGEPIDTGMSPEDTVDCLLTHEGDEKVILDADNDVDTYQAAHELATTAEHEAVRKKGGSPIKYERGLKKAIEFCAKKPLKAVDPDFSCAPLLDDPDKNDHRALRDLRKLGIADAFKLPKHRFKYSRSTGADRCDGCAHWLASRDTGPELSRCALIDGLVRVDRWCAKFEEATEAKDGKAQGGDSQQASSQQLRAPGGAEVSDAGQESRGEREGPGDTGGEGGSDVAQYGLEDQSQGQP